MDLMDFIGFIVNNPETNRGEQDDLEDDLEGGLDDGEQDEDF